MFLVLKTSEMHGLNMLAPSLSWGENKAGVGGGGGGRLQKDLSQCVSKKVKSLSGKFLIAHSHSHFPHI